MWQLISGLEIGRLAAWNGCQPLVGLLVTLCKEARHHTGVDVDLSEI